LSVNLEEPLRMTTEERLNDLLQEWLSLHQQGRDVPAAELCGDCPELLAPLDERIGVLRRMNAMVGGRADSPAGAAVANAETGNRQSGQADTSWETVVQAAPGEPLPKQVSGYRVLGLLGEGGMGRVLHAVDPGLGREVAVKVMRADLARDEAARRRFLREARAVAALQHDHVVAVHQVGEDQGVPFFVMPLLAGESLEARLRREGHLPVTEVLRVGREAAEGLAAAHERGLVHRDVKPANLWLEAPTGRVKVLDFGLAREQTASDAVTLSGAVLGTPGYLSPEQLDGGPIDARADLFSLGCVLYRAATGRPPFQGETLTALLRAVAEHQPPPPHQVRVELPRGLSELILRMLEKSPPGRPAGARELIDALAALGPTPGGLPAAAGLCREGGPTPSTARLPARNRRARRVVVWASGVAAALAAMSLTWALWPTSRVTPQGEGGGAAAGPEEPVRIAPLKVMLYEQVGKQGVPRGQMGKDVFAARFGDAVTVTVELSEPAYFYLIGFNFDGKEQLVCPADDKGNELPDKAPPRLGRLRFPAHDEDRLFLKEDDAKSGVQAYVVVVSRSPLPGYAEWRKRRGDVRWGRLPAVERVWQADAKATYPVAPNGDVDRGKVERVPGEPPLAALCRALSAGGEVVEAVAFGVLAKEAE
jgi:hypothetical protein